MAVTAHSVRIMFKYLKCRLPPQKEKNERNQNTYTREKEQNRLELEKCISRHVVACTTFKRYASLQHFDCTFEFTICWFLFFFSSRVSNTCSKCVKLLIKISVVFLGIAENVENIERLFVYAFSALRLRVQVYLNLDYIRDIHAHQFPTKTHKTQTNEQSLWNWVPRDAILAHLCIQHMISIEIVRFHFICHMHFEYSIRTFLAIWKGLMWMWNGVKYCYFFVVVISMFLLEIQIENIPVKSAACSKLKWSGSKSTTRM